MAAGTKVSAERHLRRRPAQIWEVVRWVCVFGGFSGAVKARLFVGAMVVEVEVVVVVGLGVELEGVL